jgi:AcrR family transcriptional regulator
MDTKTRILTGAGELFFKYGIKSITMDDIAKHLGMSKKTIYQFFEDKDQIVLSLTRANLAMHQNNFETIEKNSKDPIHEIVNSAEQMKNVFTRINPVMFYDMQKYYPKAWADFKEFKEKCVFEMIENNLQRGIKMGLYRKNIDVKIMATLRIEEVEMAMDPNRFPAERYNLSKVQVELLDHFLHGICTLKGHKLLNKYQHITEEE